jgi:hypothetical protein
MPRPKYTVQSAADSLSVEQKERLQEVANELLTIYQTLVSMRYVESDALIPGPHDLSEELLETYSKLKLDPAVIYLYSIMPCIDDINTQARDFFQGSAFFNPLSPRDVEDGRDPRFLMPEGSYDDEQGQYMYPWYTPLSSCANHSPMLIYDAREHRIWCVDQEGTASTDPVFCPQWYRDAESVKEGSNWGDDSEDSSWEDEDDQEDADEMEFSDAASHGSSEFWNDEDAIDQGEVDAMITDQEEDVTYDEGFEHVEELTSSEQKEAANITNENSLENAKSRAAGDVLRDVNAWYRALKELPGQGEYNHWLDPAILRPLYRNNGWPDAFDGDALEVAMARADATERARYKAEEPLRQVECYDGWMEYPQRDIERYQQDISSATTPNAEWTARFALWKAEETLSRNTKDLADAKQKAEKLCPNGVAIKPGDEPLWEMEWLRIGVKGKRSSIKHAPNLDDDPKLQAEFEKNPRLRPHLAARNARDLHELALLEKALAASTADAERLCPGRSFAEATGIKSLGGSSTGVEVQVHEELIRYFERYIREVREFGAKVPKEAVEATEAVEKEVRGIEEAIAGCRRDIERAVKWVAEHGEDE